MKKPEVDVAFGASSTKIAGHAGVASLVEERFTPVRVSGSSGGAIMAVIWALLGAKRATQRILEADYTDMVSINWVSLARWAFFGYLSKGEELYDAIHSVTGDRTFSSPDLKFDVYITASNMTEGVLEVYSKETHPDMDLATAVYRSATMPGVFKPMDDGKNRMRDGAIYRDLPIDIWPDHPRPRIGHTFENDWRPENKPGIAWNGLKEHQLLLARAIDDNLDQTVSRMLQREDVYILSSSTMGLNNFSFGITDTQKQELFDTGYYIAMETSHELLNPGGRLA